MIGDVSLFGVSQPAVLNILISTIHTDHFITRASFNMSITKSSVGWLFGQSAKRYGLHFSIATRPDAQTDCEGRAGCFQAPPEEIRRDGSGVERRNEEMQKMDGQSEVRYEFRSRDKKEERHHPAMIYRCTGQWL